MWEFTRELLAGGTIQKVQLLYTQQPLTYREAVNLWRCDSAFREFFISLLTATPFPAYFWETPAVTETSFSQPFEFVLIDSTQLAGVPPDQEAFSEHFWSPGEHTIATFPSLGKDALLVAPCPSGPASQYPHLAAFARHAPAQHQHALWQAVATALQARIGAQPLWLSTSGLGVFWLHVRIDTRPKYYQFKPYTRGV